MELSEYLSTSGCSQVAFARVIGVTQQMVSALSTRRRHPSRDLIRRIHVATNGAVSWVDWNPLEEALQTETEDAA